MVLSLEHDHTVLSTRMRLCTILVCPSSVTHDVLFFTNKYLEERQREKRDERRHGAYVGVENDDQFVGSNPNFVRWYEQHRPD